MQIIYLIAALLFALTVHEAAHAWVAYQLGDPTAKNEGRISLNPFRHLDPVGTVMIFIAQFGWGKPVPFNEDNLRYPRLYTALIAIAGPLSNLFSALVIAFIFKYYSVTLPSFLVNLLSSIYFLSVILFLFNLLPIAPLDGSKIVAILIPKKYQYHYQNYLAKGPLILISIILFDRLLSLLGGPSPLSIFIGYGLDFVNTLILLAT